MEFELPKLPYELDELEPYVSARTLRIHYLKHHQGYVDKLEKALSGKPLARKSLVDIVCETDGDTYNNAAQVWNHSFYWSSMTRNGGGSPRQSVAAAIERDFGGVEDFKQRFAEAASGEFGSGWAWLVANDDGKLRVISSTDAENPMRSGQHPLLTLDVWEHAYYLDYQNERGKYIAAFLDHLLNWAFVEKNLNRVNTTQQAKTA